jgi:hypothetical protein
MSRESPGPWRPGQAYQVKQVLLAIERLEVDHDAKR